jgi:hypothetical protein
MGRQTTSEQKRSFNAIYIYKRTFYQDRLGTNIAKALKKRLFSLRLFHVADWYHTLSKLAGVDPTDDWTVQKPPFLSQFYTKKR